MSIRRNVCLVALLASCTHLAPAFASPHDAAPTSHPSTSTGTDDNSVWAKIDETKATPGDGDSAGGDPAQPVLGLPPGHYATKPVCSSGGDQTCGDFAYCPDGSLQMWVWYQTNDGRQLGMKTSCGTAPATSSGPATIDALSELRHVALPASALHVQPVDNQTLVHFKTNYYTDGAPFDATVTVGGGATNVDFKIRPIEFDWTFGDGTTAKTSTPGAPYPNLEVTHEYATTGTVQAHVDTVWGADYRVDGGAWAPVNGTVTKQGADVTITIRQATPVLTD